MSDNASFADFVKEAREKKKNEVLAQQFLGSRGRKPNGSGAGALANGRPNSQKPSLLSRMSGVQKPRSSSAKPTVPAQPASSSINGKWQHDLHGLNNPNGPASKRLNRTASASQIDRNTRTYDKFASVLTSNARSNEAPDSSGFNIRGVATGGPYTVIASNFAPGTTAADIEAVMAPHGGEILSCRLLTSAPTVMAELVCAAKEGADNIIATFNNKKADGRSLYVYLKDVPSTSVVPNAALAHSRPPAPRAAQPSYDSMDVDTNAGARAGSFQDGRYGFNENTRREPPRGPRRRY